MALYRFDAHEEVLERLTTEAGDFIHRTTHTMLSFPHGRYIADSAVGVAAGIDGTEALRGFARTAFCSGAVIALCAQDGSDLEPHVNEQVRNDFYTQCTVSAPIDPDRITTLTVQGFLNHPELQVHAALLRAYYAGITQDARVGVAAWHGVGVITALLDHSVQVLSQDPSAQLLPEVDWDSAAAELPGSQ